MSATTSPDTVSRPAMVLVAGRAVGFAAAFAIPVVLARVFDPAEFGTYKQLFLVFATLYGLAQIGMAESLYYFVPRSVSEKREHAPSRPAPPAKSGRNSCGLSARSALLGARGPLLERAPSRSGDAGRYVCNALVTLALAGAGCLGLLYLMRADVSAWIANSQLSDHLVLVGLLLALTLVAAALEIVMISRGQHFKAAVTYAVSDLARTLLFIIPALQFGGVRVVLIGAVAFGVLRLAAMLVYLWREFGRELRIDVVVWRRQLAYALPFALAVSVEVVLLNFHQYIVAARFDAATFAIYAVGCLQIPLVDLVMTSTVNVMMVQMAEHARTGDRRAAMALWHDTMCRLAFVFFPLAAFLMVAAHHVIVTLFTTTYLASVPIFMIWTLTILPSSFAVDGVLRVYAQTRFLLVMNVVRFALVAALIGWLLSSFGLSGAVLVTLLAMAIVKALGAARIAHLFEATFAEALPWRRLTGIALRAIVAAAPAFWMTRTLALPPLAVLACAGAAYAATYLALCYASLTPERPDLPWSFARQVGQ